MFSRDELILGIFLLFLSAFLVAESRWSRLHNTHSISSEQPYHLYLDQRTNLSALTDSLHQAKVIKSRKEFLWAANLLGWRNFREGHYLIERGFTYDAFLSKLARGIQDPVSVTVLPGRSEGEIVRAVANDLRFDSLTFHQTLYDSTLLSQMEIDSGDVVGRLFPNTYSLYWTSSAEAVFKRFIQEFKKDVIIPHQQRFNELNKTIDEIITLASIVEWEAKSKKEKGIISGLYWNRLERGMRLQADPTVNYAVGERRRLLYEDYKKEHPYNTYLYAGLPPGPITNPSLGSIEAALYPDKHDYLYMVASPDGSHDFSRTFEEHKRKSEKWRQWIQEQYRIKRQKEQDSSSGANS